MSTQGALSLYEALFASSCEMLRAATEGRWDDLAAHEATRRQLLGQLMQTGGNVDSEATERRDALIQKTLANDAQVRELSETRMAELRATLENIQAQRRLTQTYQPV